MRLMDSAISLSNVLIFMPHDTRILMLTSLPASTFLSSKGLMTWLNTKQIFYFLHIQFLVSHFYVDKMEEEISSGLHYTLRLHGVVLS